MNPLHSIRWRLQVWHGLILLAVLSGFGFTAWQLQYANEMRRVDAELLRHLTPLTGPGGRMGPRPEGAPPGFPPPPGFSPREEMGDRGRRRGPSDESEDPPRSPPGGFRVHPRHAALFENGSNSLYYVVWNRDSSEIARSGFAPDRVPAPAIAGSSGRTPTSRLRGSFREMYEASYRGDRVLVGRSIAPELDDLGRLALWLSGLGVAVLVLGLAGGGWLAARAISPIQDISATASIIAKGDLSQRIPVKDTDNELGQLATLLNSTFSRLDAAFRQQAQFSSDASHELRTPIAVILTQTQMALARERPASEYRETLEACQRAAQRMRRLVDSLLELARFDSGQAGLQQLPLDLARLVEECVDMIRPLAEQRSALLAAEPGFAPCVGDPDRLSQVITNLITNALIHNPRQSPKAEVHVRSWNEGGHAIVAVTDNGVGIPSDMKPRLFERFWRADASRASATGGTGLGLAICKAIVESHGGSLEVESEPGQGSAFIVRLPLSPSPSSGAGS